MSDKPADDFLDSAEFATLMGDAQTRDPQEEAAARALFRAKCNRLAEDRPVKRPFNLKLMLAALVLVLGRIVFANEKS